MTSSLRRAVHLLLHPRELWRTHRGVAIGLIAGLVLAIAGIAVAYELLKRPADVHNQAAIEQFEPPPKSSPPPPSKPTTVNWPMFGLNPARTKYLPASGIKPPYRLVWHYAGRPLLEFPPIYANGRLYAVDNSGNAFALDAETGKVLWERRIGHLNASSPAYSHERLYIVNLVPGHIVKLDAKTGKLLWKRSLPGRAESSPLVLGDTVYFGCENGQLFALSTSTGKVRWATTLGGPVKSAPAYRHGVLYVGDYGGYMNAVRASDGKLLWQSGSLGPGFGGSGEFYSTPAVAYGRVYAGNNDGRVYSYDQSDGALAWTHSTGNWVYSGVAVASTPSLPPTVYVGSFDGNLYALNAQNGETRWQVPAGGQVVGSVSIVGNIVYAAEFTNKTTEGFDLKTGKKVFHYKTGTYTPVISDGRRIYLVGYSSINALEPVRPGSKRANAASSPMAKGGGGQKPAARRRPAPRARGH
ncbi:MAG: PQQ-binding-like beta-propeller repeat protein [Actinobacteria bacterium]|nr:PQQ-binding-like beta-propeller repeat protein [Actinomycetota bacterium]